MRRLAVSRACAVATTSWSGRPAVRSCLLWRVRVVLIGSRRNE